MPAADEASDLPGTESLARYMISRTLSAAQRILRLNTINSEALAVDSSVFFTSTSS